MDKSAAIANLPEETEAVTGVKPREDGGVLGGGALPAGASISVAGSPLDQALVKPAETFTPGSTLSSGFGNVAEQLGGSGYYKGVAIPTFYDKSLGDAGVETAGDQLARWKAGIDQADLSTNAPFGFVETPVYTQPVGDYDPYVSGYEQTPATAIDYLLQNNPVIADAIGPHTSTFANSYKIVNGELKEVGASEITP